jgi:hypothetical protein
MKRLGYGRYSFTTEESEESEESAEAWLQWNYEMPEQGTLYAYAQISDDGNITILKNNEEIGSVNRQRPYLFCCGTYEKGEIMSLRTKAPAGSASGYVQVYVRLLRQDVWDEGYAALRDESLTVTAFAGTKIAGHILAKEAGLLYTSLPYEPGWRAYVDGNETAIVPLNGSMAMLPLTAGEHEIVWRFLPPGLTPGLGISACSLLAFALLVRWDRRRPKPAPEPEREPQEQEQEQQEQEIPNDENQDGGDNDD